MFKKMGFLVVVLALSASNVSSMMRAGAGERPENDRRSFTIVDDGKYFLHFKNVVGKTVPVEVPSEDVSLAMLKVLVLEAFGHDAEVYSVRLLFRGTAVTNENFADYKGSSEVHRIVIFYPKAVS